MAGEVGAINAVDATGSTASPQSQSDAADAAQDAAVLSAGMDNYIMNCIFFTFSTMQSIVSEGMRQNSAFLSETQVQDSNE
jgi:hypothetical protein